MHKLGTRRGFSCLHRRSQPNSQLRLSGKMSSTRQNPAPQIPERNLTTVRVPTSTKTNRNTPRVCASCSTRALALTRGTNTVLLGTRTLCLSMSAQNLCLRKTVFAWKLTPKRTTSNSYNLHSKSEIFIKHIYLCFRFCRQVWTQNTKQKQILEKYKK